VADGPLSPEAVRALFAVARRALVEALAGQAADDEDDPGPYYEVNLTVYRDGRVCASMSGRAHPLAAAVSAAARRAAADRRFGEAILPEWVPDVRLDLWVLTGRARFATAEDVLATVDLGLDGVEFRLGRRTAYYKPSVALTSGITDPDRLMRKLAAKAGLAPGAWRDPRGKIWRTSWEHFVDAPALRGQPVRLRRLRPAGTAPLDRAVVARAARAAQERLLAAQAADGTYLYRYQPLKDRVVSGNANLVRQAGTMYAVARSAARESDPRHAERLRRSASDVLDYLLGRRSRSATGGFFIRDLGGGQPRGQLGTAALTLLGLQYGELDETRELARRGLRAWVLGQQNSDGSFRCFSDTTSVVGDGPKQDYFPGEAMLALGYEARRGIAPCASALDRGFAWSRAHFRRTRAAAFVPWHIDAWRLFGEVPGRGTHQAALADFVFELTDWILRRQLTADVPADFIGGFSGRGGRPGFSTATYTEAVIRAFGLAVQAGDEERTRRYRAAALLGLRFALRLQISPQTAALFPAPSLAVGGVTASLHDFVLRCDHDQHLITACLTALETPDLLD
jgi:AMMECR1 domain-containing protein